MAQRKRRVKKGAKHKPRGLGQLPPRAQLDTIADRVREMGYTIGGGSSCSRMFRLAYLHGRTLELNRTNRGSATPVTRETAVMNLRSFDDSISAVLEPRIKYDLINPAQSDLCVRAPTLRALAGIPKKPKALGQIPSDHPFYDRTGRTAADELLDLHEQMDLQGTVIRDALAQSRRDPNYCRTAYEAMADNAFTLGQYEVHAHERASNPAREQFDRRVESFNQVCRR